DQGTRDRHPERGHRRPAVVAEDQERHRDRGEDDDAAHGGRARLLVMALRALLADVLAELAHAQERDELRAEEDADEQRRRARDEDLPHQRRPTGSVPCSAWATTSRPTPRDPLTRTVSPSRSSEGTSCAASAAPATWCTSPAPSP